MLQKLEETTEQAATDKQKLHSAIELNRQLHIQLEELKNSNVIQTLLTFSFRKQKIFLLFPLSLSGGAFLLKGADRHVFSNACVERKKKS